MPKKRLYFGVVDPITIIGVLFLIITLGIGTYVVSDKKFSFNIFEKAAKNDFIPEEDLKPDSPTGSGNKQDNSFNWDKDYITKDEKEFIEETQGDPFNQLNNNPPPQDQFEEPTVSEPTITQPNTPTTLTGKCIGETAEYDYGAIVVYAGQGSLKKCGTLANGQIGWVDCPTTNPECRLANVTNAPAYLQEEQNQDIIEQQNQQEIALQQQANQGYITPDELDLITRQQQDLNRIANITPNTTDIIKQTENKQGTTIVVPSYVTGAVPSSQKVTIPSYVTGAMPTGQKDLDIKTAGNTSCANGGVTLEQKEICRQIAVTTAYNSNYVQAFSNPNNLYIWQQKGYSSSNEAIQDCVKQNGINSAYACTKQMTAYGKDQVTSSVDLGTDIASVITLPLAPAYFGTKSLVMFGFQTFGSTMTVQQTKNAVVAQIENPGFFKPRSDINPNGFWETVDPQTYLTDAGYQTAMAGLGWWNLSTADDLVRAWGQNGNEILQQAARVKNTFVSGANLWFDTPYAVNTCTETGLINSDCGYATIAPVLDLVFGGLDVYQGQLTLNPIGAITETVDSLAPSLVNVNRLANNPLNEIQIPIRVTTPAIPIDYSLRGLDGEIGGWPIDVPTRPNINFTSDNLTSVAENLSPGTVIQSDINPVTGVRSSDITISTNSRAYGPISLYTDNPDDIELLANLIPAHQDQMLFAPQENPVTNQGYLTDLFNRTVGDTVANITASLPTNLNRLADDIRIQVTNVISDISQTTLLSDTPTLPRNVGDIPKVNNISPTEQISIWSDNNLKKPVILVENSVPNKLKPSYDAGAKNIVNNAQNGASDSELREQINNLIDRMVANGISEYNAITYVSEKLLPPYPRNADELAMLADANKAKTISENLVCPFQICRHNENITDLIARGRGYINTYLGQFKYSNDAGHHMTVIITPDSPSGMIFLDSTNGRVFYDPQTAANLFTSADNSLTKAVIIGYSPTNAGPIFDEFDLIGRGVVNSSQVSTGINYSITPIQKIWDDAKFVWQENVTKPFSNLNLFDNSSKYYALPEDNNKPLLGIIIEIDPKSKDASIAKYDIHGNQLMINGEHALSDINIKLKEGDIIVSDNIEFRFDGIDDSLQPIFSMKVFDDNFNSSFIEIDLIPKNKVNLSRDMISKLETKPDEILLFRGHGSNTLPKNMVAGGLRKNYFTPDELEDLTASELTRRVIEIEGDPHGDLNQYLSRLKELEQEFTPKQVKAWALSNSDMNISPWLSTTNDIVGASNFGSNITILKVPLDRVESIDKLAGPVHLKISGDELLEAEFGIIGGVKSEWVVETISSNDIEMMDAILALQNPRYPLQPARPNWLQRNILSPSTGVWDGVRDVGRNIREGMAEFFGALNAPREIPDTGTINTRGIFDNIISLFNRVAQPSLTNQEIPNITRLTLNEDITVPVGLLDNNVGQANPKFTETDSIISQDLPPSKLTKTTFQNAIDTSLPEAIKITRNINPTYFVLAIPAVFMADYVSENVFNFDLIDTSPILDLFDGQVDDKSSNVIGKGLSAILPHLSTPPTIKEPEYKDVNTSYLDNIPDQPIYNTIDIIKNEDGTIIFTDNYNELPSTTFMNKQVTPTKIVIHWDGNANYNDPTKWTTSATINGLVSRDTSSHFAVGVDGAVQLVPMSENTVSSTWAYTGDPEVINIEFGGAHFNEVWPKENEINSGIELIAKLVVQYDFTVEDIVGHRDNEPNPEFVEFLKIEVQNYIDENNLTK